MKYTLIEDGARSSLVILYPSSNEMIPYTMSHPKWDELYRSAKDGSLESMSEEETLKVVNTDAPVAVMSIASISDRIKISTRGSTLDGVPIDDSLARDIKAVLGEQEISDEHMNAIKNFLDKADSNPSMENSSKLYRWIASEKLTLAPDGDFIGYKSLTSVPEDQYDYTFPEVTTLPNGDHPVKCADVLRNKGVKVYRASRAGGGITDGVEFPGHVPNYLGAVVEMPRDKVDSNGYTECSVGLHVGTYGYASSFVGDMMALVKVNPRDVVSVPEYDYSKLRACRYTVVAVDVSGQLDSNLYIDEQFAPVIGEATDSSLSGSDKSGIVSRIITRIKQSIKSE